MNSITFKDPGYFNEKLKINKISWQDLILKEISQYMEKIEKNSFLDKTTLNKITNYIKKTKI